MDENFALYEDICHLVENTTLKDNEFLAIIAAVIWYMYPVLNRTPENIGEDIVMLIKRWKLKDET